ncbi:trypco2 family protein [Streptomyces sp. NPDC051554]|uniref:trypco2 family protein n=1 Tax=Streptomyces sp. NPDC051554 TaxID=3365656 RepID=UPI00379FC9DA
MGGFASDEIGLADAVEAVRDQLIEAAGRNASQDVRFQVGPITMEFTVELRREASGKAEVKAWILGSSAEGKVTKSNLHRVQLTMTPLDSTTGQPYEISNPDPGDVSGFFGSAD